MKLADLDSIWVRSGNCQQEQVRAPLYVFAVMYIRTYILTNAACTVYSCTFRNYLLYFRTVLPEAAATCSTVEAVAKENRSSNRGRNVWGDLYLRWGHNLPLGHLLLHGLHLFLVWLPQRLTVDNLSACHIFFIEWLFLLGSIRLTTTTLLFFR